MTAGIYSITNSITGKKYIGQSTSIYSRWSKHKSDYKYQKRENPYFKNAIDKYGFSNFDFKIIIILPPYKWLLNIIEKLFILILNTKIPNGYNANIGGGSGKGWNPTKLQKEHMKISRKNGNGKKGKKSKKATSKYYGVCKHIKKGKYIYWRSQVGNIYLGDYKSEIEAAQKYNEYIIKNKIDYPLNILDK